MSGSLSPTALARLLGQWHLGATPAYRELADVVRLLVLDGRIPLGTALPSERTLAATLAVSRTTVTAAYSSLREQGFLSSGQGTRGRTCLPRSSNRAPGTEAAARTGLSGAPGLAVPDGVIDLAYASLPASGEVVHRAFAAALTELPALLPGFGYDALGVPALREAIAGRYTAVGVSTTPAQILVTSGAQHALNIVLRAIVGRQDKVLVEHPTYPNALDAIRATGCRMVPVALRPTPEMGWDLDAVEAALMQQRPRLAYMVPDFHNPTGRLMSDAQRRRLVRAATASGTVLVADETLRELNLDGGTAAPLASFSPAVVSIGSLS
jgi:DNA-binding transcriptional MocR family regulator